METMDKVDYTTVTEITGYNVTSEQLRRMYTRYRFASDFCEGQEVLEVACGSGQGLGYLAKKAKRVVGGDYDDKLVKIAQNYYKNRIDIKQIDAHNLPFPDKSFDVVILYEAIYYLKEPEQFVSEARRVLRENGILLICTANKDWAGFNPSPYSYRYFSASELYSLLTEKGYFGAELFADCPACSNDVREKMISFIKQLAIKLHLIPKTMKGKEKLKRLFMGKLTPLPPEIDDGIAEYTRPVPIPHYMPVKDYKVVYAVGHVNAT